MRRILHERSGEKRAEQFVRFAIEIYRGIRVWVRGKREFKEAFRFEDAKDGVEIKQRLFRKWNLGDDMLQNIRPGFMRKVRKGHEKPCQSLKGPIRFEVFGGEDFAVEEPEEDFSAGVCGAPGGFGSDVEDHVPQLVDEEAGIRWHGAEGDYACVGEGDAQHLGDGESGLVEAVVLFEMGVGKPGGDMDVKGGGEEAGEEFPEFLGETGKFRDFQEVKNRHHCV